MVCNNSLAIDNKYYINNIGSLSEPKVQSRSILLIEDSKSDVLLIKKMLRDASDNTHFEFTDVPRLVDALELFDTNSYDLILLDLNLLDIDGIATVSALRAQVSYTPIIVHSGTNDPKLKQEALMCGAKHYLVKGRESPFSFKFMVQQSLSHAAA